MRIKIYNGFTTKLCYYFCAYFHILDSTRVKEYVRFIIMCFFFAADEIIRGRYSFNLKYLVENIKRYIIYIKIDYIYPLQ